MFDIALPVTSKDAQGGQVVSVTVTEDGNKWVTWTINYHTMSNATFAEMGALVGSFFEKEEHINLSPKQFNKWEDKFAAMIKNYRDGGKGHGTGKKK